LFRPLSADHRAIAMAASLGAKKKTPFTSGRCATIRRLRLLVLGTVVIIGALLFLPIAHSGRWRALGSDFRRG